VCFSPSINPFLSQVVHKPCIFPGRHSKFYICAISGSDDKPLPICSGPEAPLTGAKGDEAVLITAESAARPSVFLCLSSDSGIHSHTNVYSPREAKKKKREREREIRLPWGKKDNGKWVGGR